MFFVVFYSLLAQVLCDGYNRALHFPKEPSLDNYVILNPDFSDLGYEYSVCAWLKVSVDSAYTWFSYATPSDANTIQLNVRSGHWFSTTGGKWNARFDGVKMMNNEWYHTCFTYKSGDVAFYLNGVLIPTSGNTPPTGQLIPGGVLVLGQDQDSMGGSFDIDDTFSGEMYNLNVFKKRLALEDVAGMYYSGRCADLARSVAYEIVLSWVDILNAKRYGTVTAVDAGCERCTGAKLW